MGDPFVLVTLLFSLAHVTVLSHDTMLKIYNLRAGSSLAPYSLHWPVLSVP